jgi:hypothetical protein
MGNIKELLSGHVTLAVECVDRLYLNGYQPKLVTPGGLVYFMTEHRGKPIPSPAILGAITQSWIKSVGAFAEANGVSIIKFEPRHGRSDTRKDDIATKLRQERGINDGVVFIGVAQEKARSFAARKVVGANGGPSFDFTPGKSVAVNHYYFYVEDLEFGPAFIKICAYAPWPIKVCLNGHEWAKRQLSKRAIAFEALDNGFFSCADPQALQSVCDELAPEAIDAFFRRWLDRLPLPLAPQDRAAGYDWLLSIWQMEVSLTQVFDRPQKGREFFEEVIRDNLDLGRPDRVNLIFERRVRSDTPSRFRTSIVQHGVQPSLHIEYKHFHLKQYFKEGRALRTEGTFNDPGDFDVNKGLSNFAYLQQLGRRINRRLLDVERVSQNCGLSADSLTRVVRPTVTEDGCKAPGLRFGDPRVLALFLALNLFVNLIAGFRNHDLRQAVGTLLATPYSSSQASYDLRRLMRKGLIHRRPKTNLYVVTPYGWKVARLFCRLDARILRPASVAFTQASTVDPHPSLAQALARVDSELDRLITAAFPPAKAA